MWWGGREKGWTPHILAFFWLALGLPQSASRTIALSPNNAARSHNYDQEVKIVSNARSLLQQSVVSIIKGPDTYVTNENITIEFEVSVFHLSTKCQLLLDNNVLRYWHDCETPYNLQALLTRDGKYTFMIEADTGSGDEGPTRVSWTVDRIGPDVSLHDLPSNNTTQDYVQVNFEAFDHLSGIKKVECRLDDQVWISCKSGIAFRGLAAGLHTIQVRSTDNAGNEQAQPVSYSWTVRSLDEAAASNPPLTNPPETKNGGRFGQGSNQQEESKKNFEDTTLSRLNDAKEAATENLHITIIIVIGVLFLGLACCVMFFRKLQKTRQERQLLSGDSVELGPTRPLSVVNPMTDLHIGNRERSLVLHAALPLGLKRFKYEELRKATGGFPETRVLGEGGFGKVYRGKLQDNTLVAVKRLDKGGQQGDREFYVEVSTLSSMNHPNVVRCLGACVESGNRCCVFDLMKGNTRDLLDEKNKKFSWSARLRVMIGAARGLAHLHDANDPAIVHRDFKTENILLDSKGEAQISDFGLSIKVTGGTQARPRDTSVHDSRPVVPTFGYIAPEYATGQITTKSDVYSLGVVMLELLTGRRPVDTSLPQDEQNLVKWIQRNADNFELIKSAVDPQIRDQVSEIQLAEFTEKSAACLETSPSRRPSAAEIAVTLEKLLAIENRKQQYNGITDLRHITVMADGKITSDAGTFLSSIHPEDGGLNLSPAGTLLGMNVLHDKSDGYVESGLEAGEEWEEGDAEAGPSQRKLLRRSEQDAQVSKCAHELDRWDGAINWNEIENPVADD